MQTTKCIFKIAGHLSFIYFKYYDGLIEWIYTKGMFINNSKPGENTGNK